MKRFTKENSCDGKKRFSSERAAQKHVAYRISIGATRIQARYCKFCFGYHVQTMIRKPK